jgi:hypothetical protein
MLLLGQFGGALPKIRRSAEGNTHYIAHNRDINHRKPDMITLTASEFTALTAPNEPDDADKVQVIAESLLESGWGGAPVVYFDGGWLLTGSHRQAAVSEVASDIPSLEIPAISLEEVFTEAGLDLCATMDGEGSQEPWDSGFAFVLGALPAATLAKYGIQF